MVSKKRILNFNEFKVLLRIALLGIGIFYFSITTASSQAFLDSMTTLLNSATEDSVRSRLNKEIGVYYRFKNTDSCLYFNQIALDFANKAGEKEEAAFLSKDIGITLNFQGKFEDATKFLNQGLAYFIASGNKKHEAHTYGVFAIMHDMQGDTKAALEYNEKGLTIVKEIDDQLGIARSENNKGLLLQAIGDLEGAMTSFLHALEIHESFGHKEKIANVLNNISRIHIEQKNYLVAIDYAERVGKIAEPLNDLFLLATVYSNLGAAYLNLDSLEKALEYLSLELDLEREQELGPEIGNVLVQIGTTHRKMGSYQEAEDAFTQATEVFSSFEEELAGYPTLLFETGMLYKDQKQYRKAIDQFSSALRLLQEGLRKTETAMCYEALAQCYAALGEHGTAYKQQEKYILLKDSILNKNKVEALAEMEERFKAAKKEKEIFELEAANAIQELSLNRQLWIIGLSLGAVILFAIAAVYLYRNNQIRRKQNRLLTEQKQEINQKNQQNELLLKEIHHRVKNNLQSVSSLLNLQSESIEDEAVRAAVNKGKHRVQSIALLHQRLYQGTNLAAIEMKSYFETLSESLFDAFGIDMDHIHLNIQMEPYEMDIDTAVPLGLITNELMTNSLKYAFPDGRKGEILIQLIPNAQEGRILLTVSDDGVGNMTTEGEAKGTAFGSRLIQLLLLQLEGEMVQHSETGYKTQISFPRS